MTEDSDDKITRLYQGMAKASPSALLDARIKKMAHQQMHRGRGIQPLRWLSAAALIVLSVGVVLRVVQEVPVKNDLDEIGVSLEPMKDEAEMSMPMPSTLQSKQDSLTGELVAPAEKRQSMPAVIKDVAPRKHADYAEESLQRLKKDALQQHDAEILQKAPDAMTGPVLKEKTISVENWCGQADLKSEQNKQIWLERVAQLKQENQAGQAECLEQLMLSVFADDLLVKPGD